MNYTPNYHLPQWSETDRVLMTDFNTAMAGLEAGLTANREETGQVRTDLNAAIGQAVSASESGALLRQLRTTRNLLTTVVEQAHTPPLESAFVQRMDTGALPSNVTGMLARADHCLLVGGGDTVTKESFLAAMTTVTEMKVVKSQPSQAVPLKITFTAPGPCVLKRIMLSGGYSNNDGGSLPTTVTLTDTTSGTTLYSKEHTLAYNLVASREIREELLLNLTLVKGHAYQLTATSTDYRCSATVRFDKNTPDDLDLEIFAASGQVTRTLSSDRVSPGGVVLVRYGVTGGGGVVSLNWDGTALSSRRTVAITDEKGRSMLEAEFRKTESIPTSSKLTLNLTGKSGGELRLYSWSGAVV